MPHSTSATFDLDMEIVDSTEHVSVSVVDNLRDVEALRSEWSAMQWHPNSDIDFYTNVVRAWSDRCKPYVLAIRRLGVLEAILVGRAETVRVDCNFGYKTLFRMKARQLTFIYGGTLGEFSYESCLAILDTIRATLDRGEADLAEFHFIKTHSNLYRALKLKERIREPHATAQLHRSSTVGIGAQDALRRLSAKRRKNLRWKKLLHDFEGGVNIQIFEAPGSVAQMYADVESIACKTYHRQLGVGFDGSEELRQRLTSEGMRGHLRAYVLYLASQPVAFWIATAYKGALYSDFMGYDPALAKYSPGMYLITKILEDICRGESDPTIEKVDWGLGDAEYKEALGDSSWIEANVKIFSRAPRGFALKLAIVPIDMVNARLKHALAHSGMLQKVKTRWRRRLTGTEGSVQQASK